MRGRGQEGRVNRGSGRVIERSGDLECLESVRGTESPPSHTPAHNTLTCVQPPLHGFTQFSHLWVAPHCHNYVTDFHQGLFGARSLQTIVEDFILLFRLVSP